MELVLVVVGLLVFKALPLAVVVVPPVAMASRHRWTVPAVALWVLALGLLEARTVAGTVAAARDGATGGTASIWAGLGWLLAAGVVAAGSATFARRQTSRPAPTAG